MWTGTRHRHMQSSAWVPPALARRRGRSPRPTRPGHPRPRGAQGGRGAARGRGQCADRRHRARGVGAAARRRSESSPLRADAPTTSTPRWTRRWCRPLGGSGSEQGCTPPHMAAAQLLEPPACLTRAYAHGRVVGRLILVRIALAAGPYLSAATRPREPRHRRCYSR